MVRCFARRMPFSAARKFCIMSIYSLDPLHDCRWDALVASHSNSSVFHQKGWLEALTQTYRYRPVALTSTAPGKALSDGVVFCEVKSWLTGTRLVSLPFADHAEPLLDQSGSLSELSDWMRTNCRRHGWKYIELRPLLWEGTSDCSLEATQSFWIHTLDLTVPLEKLFCNLHKACVQRRIRRAERAQLIYERGCSEGLVDDFYRLLAMTRKRHQLPPQPRAWFDNLVERMNPNAEIRLARKDGHAIAASFALRHRRTVVYKYGCSDEQFHHLGAMPMLIWKMIEESKMGGMEQIDFGRTDLDNDGLIEFKDRFGTTRRRLTYFRYQPCAGSKNVLAAYLPFARRLFSALPTSVSSAVGQLLYRHIG